jgi:hypothetical protein
MLVHCSVAEVWIRGGVAPSPGTSIHRLRATWQYPTVNHYESPNCRILSARMVVLSAVGSHLFK